MGNRLLITPNNRLAIGKTNRLRVGGAGDPCCCESGMPICPPAEWAANPPGSIDITLAGIVPCPHDPTQYRWNGDPNGSFTIPLAQTEVWGGGRYRFYRYQWQRTDFYPEAYSTFYGEWRPLIEPYSWYDVTLYTMDGSPTEVTIYVAASSTPPDFFVFGVLCPSIDSQPYPNQNRFCHPAGGHMGTATIDWTGNPLP